MPDYPSLSWPDTFSGDNNLPPAYTVDASAGSEGLTYLESSDLDDLKSMSAGSKVAIDSLKERVERTEEEHSRKLIEAQEETQEVKEELSDLLDVMEQMKVRMEMLEDTPEEEVRVEVDSLLPVPFNKMRKRDKLGFLVNMAREGGWRMVEHFADLYGAGFILRLVKKFVKEEEE